MLLQIFVKIGVAFRKPEVQPMGDMVVSDRSHVGNTSGGDARRN